MTLTIRKKRLSYSTQNTNIYYDGFMRFFENALTIISLIIIAIIAIQQPNNVGFPTALFTDMFYEKIILQIHVKLSSCYDMRFISN